jgi:proline iminopeptidase
VFFPWLAPLAASHHLIALDLPGHGRSEDGDRAAWTLSGYAAAVAGFAAERELEHVTVLGHSFGSFVALTCAVEQPACAERFIASCGAARDDDLPPLAERLATLEPAELRERVAAAFVAEGDVRTPEDCRDVWLAELPFFLGDPASPRLAELEERFAQVAYRPEVSVHEGWEDLDLREGLGRLERPLLVIAGERDRSIPASASRRIAEYAPHAELCVLDDVGHMPFAEEPERYCSVVGDWLART